MTDKVFFGYNKSNQLYNNEVLMFIDKAKIIVISGAGGDGMVSFRREKYVPRGGPSGGDGGKGGSVFIRATPELNTLMNFRRKRKFAAAKGENGGAKEMFGKSGDDIFIDVPLGTMVYDQSTNKKFSSLREGMADVEIPILQPVLYELLLMQKKENLVKRKRSAWN